eukprot:10245719-Alexandrium_andersonii.AAC.1
MALLRPTRAALSPAWRWRRARGAAGCRGALSAWCSTWARSERRRSGAATSARRTTCPLPWSN